MSEGYSYFCSQTFGLYRCANWHYDAREQVWERVGQAMGISEFALDLNNPDEFQACRSGGSICVRRPTHYGDDDWHEVYSVAAARAQYYPITFANFRWVAINSAPGKEGHIYTLACEKYNTQGKRIFFMKSVDYGATWSATTVIQGIIRAIGGVWVGRVTGGVVYVSYSGHGIITNCHVRYSASEGGSGSWKAKQVLGGAIWATRVMIDPSAENVTFMGNPINGPDLWRASTVAGGISRVKYDAGICIFEGFGGGWISAWNGNYVRTIRDNRLYFSDEGGDTGTWDDNPVSDRGHGSFFERAMWGEDKKPHWVGVCSRTSIGEPTNNYHLLKSTENNGAAWHDKAGAHASTIDTGGGDSIPYNCGGVAENGLFLVVPGRVYTSVVAMGPLPTDSKVYTDGVQMGPLPATGDVYAHGVEMENPRP